MEMDRPEHQDFQVAIATFRTDVVSETFIRQHIDLLPFSNTILTGYKLSHLIDGTDITKLEPSAERAGPVELVKKWLAPPQPPKSPEDERTQKIAAFMVNNGLQVVLAEYGPTACAIVESCRIAGIPLVVHFHGYDAYEFAALRRYERCYKDIFEHSTAVIAVSRHMRQQLITLGADERSIHYIPYFVDPTLFSEINASQNPVVFIAVGRFVEKKAPHLTLLAFQRVLRSVSNARLSFVGDGPLLNSTKQLARALDLEDSVDFLGAVPHTEIHSLMSTARCFVQHSVVAQNGDREGTPVALLEAQATGLPAVSTRHTGIMDVVVEGETGFLVDEFDVESMAQGMVQLAQDPTLAAKFGRAAAVRVRGNFGQEQTLDRLAAVLIQAAQHDV